MSKKMTTLEVARLAGVTNNAVNQAILRGELNAERFGSRMYMVDEDSAMEYAARVAKHKPGPGGRGLVKALNVSITETAMDELNRMADERGISRSRMVEKMILAMARMEGMING